MDTNTLRCIVNCDPVLSQKVIKVFSADEIPKSQSSYPTAFIINTDRKQDPGRHWLAFYVTSHRGEFFDSYGRKPSSYSDVFNDFFVVNNLTLQHNDKRLQSSDSKVCGYYCIYYLINRCRGVPMNEIIHTFSNDLSNNDTFVFDVVRNAFPYCVKSSDRH
ncbi:unnamed protein product [Mytilus coruscus]|uniref:Ubiquitin-like protease family profile domain-containing protein n=1 Tax=Mytilus coruscus TaxID=42192 RepID=A0A6J8E9E2_MYTCO|nr:unnamed protein product [Mytilus coruscus]